MEPSSMHYFPVAWPFLLLLGGLLLATLVLVQLRVLTYAYERLGIHPQYVFALLSLSFLGSYINIPVAQLPPEQVVSDSIVQFAGVQYIVPTVREWPRTIIAVNVGGALIPVALALYLLARNGFYLRAIIAIIIVAAVAYHLARPVRGIGISIPIFIPPLAAALVAIVLAWRHAPALAYIAGSLGTLIGADLLNLGRIQGLGAPIASIGGAGTFDGIFLTGIVAVLLPHVAPEWRN